MHNVQIPSSARAVMVSRNHDGSERMQYVGHGDSVLNIERDLISHLSAQPCSESFLLELQSYITARLEARKEAKRHGKVAIPRNRVWSVEVPV